MKHLTPYIAFVTLACSAPLPEPDQTSNQEMKLQPTEITKSNCDLPGARDGSDLTPEELRAVLISEEFVAINGYTSISGNPDRITREGIEYASDPRKILVYRHNSICPQAAAVIKMSHGWLVAFRSAREEQSKGGSLGRAVRLNATLDRIYMEHQDFKLN